MKTILFLLLAVLAVPTSIRCEPIGDEPASAPTSARILGRIPDGTPPPPAPPKPEFIVSARDIISTKAHRQGGRTITIRKINPIDLPPPAAPVERNSATDDEEFSELAAEYRAEHPSSGLLFISATVYRNVDSPPRTLVRYWPEGGRETITFWSSADFALISGIHSFIDSAGVTRSLHMEKGARCLNQRGEAITQTELWRNGEYHSLEKILKTATGAAKVESPKAIDLASNGIILTEAKIDGSDKTGILLPVEVTVVFGIGPITPDAPTSRGLLESYLETVKTARTGDLWVVKGKDVAGADKLYCVEVANTEEKLLSALGTEGMTVVFDGHANFGIGPNFSLGMFKQISDFTNFGVKHTDIPQEFRGDGTEPDAMPDFELTGQDLINRFVDPANPTEEEWALYNGHRHLKDEGWGYLLLDPEEIMGDVENKLVPFVNRWRYETPGKDHAGAIIEKQGIGFNNEWHFDYPDGVEGANYHLIIKTPKDDLPQPIRYKTFFYNACDTGLHYIENFKHGDFVYTKRACNVDKATQAFVVGRHDWNHCAGDIDR